MSPSRHHLQQLAEEVRKHGKDFNELSHGLGPGMVDAVVGIFTNCIDVNIAKL